MLDVQLTVAPQKEAGLLFFSHLFCLEPGSGAVTIALKLVLDTTLFSVVPREVVYTRSHQL